MKDIHRQVLVIGLIAVMSWLLLSPPVARGQATGNDAVYKASKQVTFSPPFIDLSMLLPQGRDLCDTIYRLFTGFRGFPPYPSTGAVIDARGVSGATNLTCAHGSPWTENGVSVGLPSTILLPSTTGSAPIVIPTTWVLPSKTRLVGAGEAITAAGFTPGTTLQAANNFSGTAMIAFGQSSCSPCTAISVERLNLDGQGQSIDGIDNAFAQDNSYVDHVGLFRIRGTGLSISGNAAPGSRPHPFFRREPGVRQTGVFEGGTVNQ